VFLEEIPLELLMGKHMEDALAEKQEKHVQNKKIAI
jgi:hypothetical protein